MNISVGLFVKSQSDVDHAMILSEKKINCHLSFINYKDFLEYKKFIPKNLKITSLHGFNSDRDDDFETYIKKLSEFKEYFKTNKPDTEEFMVTVHPNTFGKEFAPIEWTFPEIFSYKKKKILRTPFDILRQCGRMTLDTSHLDEEWYGSENIIRALIANSDIVHFSQRANKSSESHHKPISTKGEVPINLIIKALNQKPVKELVLEYMPEFFNIAIKDYFSLSNVISSLKKVD